VAVTYYPSTYRNSIMVAKAIGHAAIETEEMRSLELIRIVLRKSNSDSGGAY
jgi:hypothetical protein